MKQSRVDSFMEALCNIIIGFGVSFVANYFILPPILGVTVTASQNLEIGLWFTLVSLARSYIIRRTFNGRGVWETVRGKITS